MIKYVHKKKCSKCILNISEYLQMNERNNGGTQDYAPLIVLTFNSTPPALFYIRIYS